MGLLKDVQEHCKKVVKDRVMPKEFFDKPQQNTGNNPEGSAYNEVSRSKNPHLSQPIKPPTPDPEDGKFREFEHVSLLFEQEGNGRYVSVHIWVDDVYRGYRRFDRTDGVTLMHINISRVIRKVLDSSEKTQTEEE